MQLLDAIEQRAQLLQLGRFRLGEFQLGDLDHQVFAARQELVQRRIEGADGDREAVHGAEDADEVVALHGQQLAQRRAAVLLVVGQDHGAHVRQTVFGEEHVLGAAQSDAFGAERARLQGVARDVGVGANAHAAERLGPAHELQQFGIVGARRRPS